MVGRLGRLALALAALEAVGGWLAGPARAQPQPRTPAAVAILETQRGQQVEEATAGAVGRMVRARVDRLETVRTSSGVALDLSEVQLALGCVGETVECLQPVADELSVRYLVIPHLDLAGDELMLTLTRYDRSEGTIERVVRRSTERAELLDAIEGQVRELFGLPPLPASAGGALGPTSGAGRRRGGPNPASFVLDGLGVVTVGVGAGFAVAFLDEQSAWADARPTDPAQVEAALATYDRAETYALVADVLFAAGGVLIAAGLTWLVVDLVSGAEGEGEGSGPDAAVAPWIAPGLAGLAAVGRWEAR